MAAHVYILSTWLEAGGSEFEVTLIYTVSWKTARDLSKYIKYYAIIYYIFHLYYIKMYICLSK